MQRSVLVATFMAVVIAAGCGGSSEPVAAARDLRPVNAEQLRGVVSEAEGKVVLVNVWATWCPPCREEFPDLVRLRRDLAADGLELVLVSADAPRQREAVLEFLSAQKVGFPTYLKEEKDMEFIEGLHPEWSGALPATLLYGRGGDLRDFWEGKADYETLLGKVRPLLEESASQGG